MTTYTTEAKIVGESKNFVKVELQDADFVLAAKFKGHPQKYYLRKENIPEGTKRIQIIVEVK